MILSRVIDYLRLRQRASVTDMALGLGATPDALREMLAVLERKGRVRRLPTGTPCGGGCNKCNPASVDIYEWRGRHQGNLILSHHDLGTWQHAHNFGTEREQQAERRTRRVVVLAFVTMVIEVTAGWFTGSMALLADGWHMASHVGALGLAAFAYRFARRHAGDARYTFGTGKVTALAGYSSALLLGAVALWMAWESLYRLITPVAIHYSEAMAIAVLGLLVNLASAWLLDHDHGNDHDHERPHHAHEHVDHNLRAAYVHVLADALTSLLAIAALAGGMWLGWRFLDPLIGLLGAVLIGRWAWGLARDSAQVLLDAENHEHVAREVTRIIEAIPDHEIADLHVWRIGPASRACIVSLVSHAPLPTEEYRRRLAAVHGLDHVTIEVNQCRTCSRR